MSTNDFQSLLDYCGKIPHLTPEEIAEELKPKYKTPSMYHLLADANDYNLAKYKAMQVYKDSGMQVREALKEIFGEELFKNL